MKSILGFNVNIVPKGSKFRDPETDELRELKEDEIYVGPTPEFKILRSDYEKIRNHPLIEVIRK
jgi:hypothetical protein